MYTRGTHPAVGETGTVKPVAGPRGPMIGLRGPRGGLVYVEWDEYGYSGVFANDLEKEKA